MTKAMIFAAAAALAMSSGALAQNWSGSPTYGQISLSGGFWPDPHSLSLQAGGGLDASAAIGGNCRGHIADAPDYNVQFTPGTASLFISAGSNADTTLVVRTPDGNWACDDDSGDGLNPGVEISKPSAGVYNIWVGTYSSGSLQPATLHVSELQFSSDQSGQGGVDPYATPNFGGISLRGGLMPDPHSVSVLAGGAEDASQLGSGCWGQISGPPDFRVNYQGGLDLFISAASASDTTLVVHDPNGTYHCDDDGGAGALNPGVRLPGAAAGVYAIWVGTFSPSGETPPATLHISEVQFFAEGGASAGATLFPYAEPNYGRTTLRAGFAPDPHSIELLAGGDRDARDMGGSCRGHVTGQPDHVLNYAPGGYQLSISVGSNTDTTLIVHSPDGVYHCDDDSNDGVNPGLTIATPQPGDYAIWVGTYSDVGAQPATLHISEVGLHSGQGGGGSTNALDPSAASNYGAITLRAGFRNDPHTISLTAGGGVDAHALGGNCRGYVTRAPDYTLDYDAGPAILYISAAADADTTLIVHRPTGEYTCDDDSGEGLNPGLRLDTPSSGRYQIWVGTYSNSGGAPARLHISELGFYE